MNGLAGWLREPWKIAAVAIAGAALWWALPRMQTTLTIFLLSLLIAYLLDPIVDRLETWRLPRLAAILALYTIFLLLVSAVALIMVPILVAQVKDVAIQFPSYLDQFYALLGKWQGIYQKLKLSPTVREQIEKLNVQAVQRAGELVQGFLGGVGVLILGTISSLAVFVTSIIISMFLLLGLDEMRRRTLELIPERHREEIRGLGNELSRLVGGFLRGQLTLCAMMGGGTWLGLVILRGFQLQFDYTLLISIMAGIGYAVPYVGSLIPMALGGFLAYFQSNGWALPIWVVLIQFIMYQVVNSVGVPIVMGREVGVSPIYVIFAIFAGGELFGFWGLILSVPVAAALRVLVLFALKKWRE